jgi:hypothetical protein
MIESEQARDGTIGPIVDQLEASDDRDGTGLAEPGGEDSWPDRARPETLDRTLPKFFIQNTLDARTRRL